MAFIKVENISRHYYNGKRLTKALSNISFTIKEGSFTVILGPSGSGKSTILNILGGMDRAKSGNIIIGNNEITSYSDSGLTEYRRSDVGFVFQFYNLIPSLNAYENVDIVSSMGSKSFSTTEMLDAVGLTDRNKHFPCELSGGELQRVSIARAICKNPELLLCDEPTGALDSKSGQKVLSLLQNMAKKYKKTVIVVTHNASIIHAADQVIRLKDGQIEEITENKSPISAEMVVW